MILRFIPQSIRDRIRIPIRRLDHLSTIALEQARKTTGHYSLSLSLSFSVHTFFLPDPIHASLLLPFLPRYSPLPEIPPVYILPKRRLDHCHPKRIDDAETPEERESRRSASRVSRVPHRQSSTTSPTYWLSLVESSHDHVQRYSATRIDPITDDGPTFTALIDNHETHKYIGNSIIATYKT